MKHSPPHILVTVRTFRQRLSATPRAARLARHLAERQLEEWGFPHGSETSTTVAAIVAELSSNAVCHGTLKGRGFALNLHCAPGGIRIEVEDPRGERTLDDHPEPPAPDAEHGRGLVIVDALAGRWGVSDREGVGKTVWAEVRAPSDDLSGSAAPPVPS